ncbi:sulfotransferase domain-containing protein [Salinibacter ruber]|uniref:sulfotransferase domain-containing protein n=1 Tax=Salinibacter ruber TaxID=146919 RepID=UPI002166C2DE|nr:sulfotransferase domain-containing protein [Salinibacter ruber]MCS3685485.1 hypothetical protein [Salinibacter ruber]
MGVLDERALRLGTDRVYEDDVFITSYLKSGNTWMRFLVTNMRYPAKKITFRNIEDYCPQLGPNEMDEYERPRFIKSHLPAFESFPRSIYVIRDGRDVAISFYHYSLEREWFDGDFSEFLRSDWPFSKYFGAWHEHVSRALDFHDDHPERMLVVRYEDMLDTPEVQAERLRSFCGFDIDRDTVKEAVRRSEFSELKKMENKHGSEVKGKDMTFFRKGESRQWKEAFSDADLAYFLDQAAPALKRAGYDV